MKARRVRYQVAASLDGFIADENGGADWIANNMESDAGSEDTSPEFDFKDLFAQFDTFLMGRHTYEMIPGGQLPGKTVYVFSNTLRQEDHPKVKIVHGNEEKFIADLKSQPGKDIWLFGGGQLFSSLLEKGLVDSVEIAVIPVLLGRGLGMAAGLKTHTRLKLARIVRYHGFVMLEHDVINTKKEHGKKPVLSKVTA